MASFPRRLGFNIITTPTVILNRRASARHSALDKLQIPDEFKLLTNKAIPVGDSWNLRRVPGGFEIEDAPIVAWRAILGTLALLIGFGFVVQNLRDWTGGTGPSIPAWVIWAFDAVMVLTCAGMLAYQWHGVKNVKSWVRLDSDAREIIVLGARTVRVPFADVCRSHLASEVVRNHGEGNSRRHYELSLHVMGEGEQALRRVSMIEGLDRELMIEVSATIQKGLGLRSGSLEGVLEERNKLADPQ